MEANKKPFGAEIIPVAPDPVSKEDADKVRVLVKLDIAKFEQQRAQAMQMVTDCDLAIAQQKVVLADLDRREANVGYPAPAEDKKADAKKDEEAK
jgi:hypothetical protein